MVGTSALLAALSRTTVRELTFKCMGTDVQLLAVGGEDQSQLDRTRTLLESLDARWSRFRPASELCRLNAAAGHPFHLTDDTFRLIAAAVEAWRLTGGRFDPTVLPALIAAGYDRSFELVAPDTPAPPSPLPTVPGCAGIALQPETGLMLLPRGVALDLGGIAKGHAADRATESLLSDGAAGALANLGGDVRVAGTPPTGGGWAIGVEDPHRPDRNVAVLRLTEGAVATSSRIRRRWIRAGRPLHHLIDPATSAPADRGIDAAVVVAGQAAWAEVLAKAALIAGPEEGAELVGRFGATGLMILTGGEVVHLPGVEDYLTVTPEAV